MPDGEGRFEDLVAQGLSSFFRGSVPFGDPIPMLAPALAGLFERLLADQEGWSRYWWIDDANPESMEQRAGATVEMAGTLTLGDERRQWIQPFHSIFRLDESGTRLDAYRVRLGDTAVAMDAIPFGARRPMHWPEVDAWAFSFDHRWDELAG